MDSNLNRVTSVEQFRDELQGLLHRARKNLERDDALANIVLLHGRPTCRQIFSTVPTDVLNEHLKQEVRQRSYECVIYVGLALAVAKGNKEAQQVYRATSSVEELGPLHDATFCIIVEGSHRDLGMHAAHWEFRREGEKRFAFGKLESGPLNGGVLADLWPKRTLN